MAYEFLSSSSRYLSASAPVSGVPMTITALFYVTTVAASQIVSVVEANGTHRNQIQIGANASASIFSQGSLTNQIVTTSITVATNTWYHYAGVFTNNSSRTAYINAANSSTGTVNVGSQNIPTQINIGARSVSNVVAQYLNGRIAEVGVWNTALTLSEIQSLAKGMTCDKIRPQNLNFYAPLIRDLQDTKGGLIITPHNGPIVAAHPRIYK